MLNYTRTPSTSVCADVVVFVALRTATSSVLPRVLQRSSRSQTRGRVQITGESRWVQTWAAPAAASGRWSPSGNGWSVSEPSVWTPALEIKPLIRNKKTRAVRVQPSVLITGEPDQDHKPGPLTFTETPLQINQNLKTNGDVRLMKFYG